MATISPNLPQPGARPWSGPEQGLGGLWRYGNSGYRDPRSGVGPVALTLGVIVLALGCGLAVATGGVNGLLLAISLIGCVFVLLEFRIGVVLLILLLPISRSAIFPHAMFGITGLNPFNLLLVGTLGSYMLQGLTDGSIRRFIPAPLVLLYVLPILAAGAIGYTRAGDIAPFYHALELVEFRGGFGYLRDVVIKPLLIVVFALLVGAAVVRSAKPERFLAPTLISVWVMALLVIQYVLQSGADLGELARSDARGFLTALGMHANELGRLYAVAFALLLFTWAGTDRPGLRYAMLASMGIIIIALLFTFSRSAFFGVALVCFFFLVWRRNFRALAFLAVAGAGAFFLLPEEVYDRLTTGFDGGLNAISAGRIESIWLPIWPEALQSPLIGHGLSGVLYSDTMRQLGGVYVIGTTHLHNAYLEAFYNMGLIGLALLLAYFWHVWKGFRALGADSTLDPSMRGFYQGAAVGLLTFLIAGIVDSALTPRPEQAFLWLAIGMMYGHRARKAAR